MPSTRMQLSIYCQDLKNAERGRWRGKLSDPYAVVTITTGGNQTTNTVLGRTETIRNTLSPDFCRVFFVDVDSSQICPFRVSIYDDNKSKNDVLMCEAEFSDLYSVFECVGDSSTPKSTQYQEILNNGGRIYVQLTPSIQGTSGNGNFGLQIRGLDMKNVECGVLGLGRSDPFYEICKKESDLTNGLVRWKTVYRSETVIDNLNPYWSTVAWIGLEELCYCDLEWPLLIRVLDWEKSGHHRLIGQVETSVVDLLNHIARNNGDRESALILTKEGKDKRKGLLVIIQAELLLQEKK